jgi:hypothetical protein
VLVSHIGAQRAGETSSMPSDRESSMQRMFLLAAMLWLVAFGMARAQVTPQASSQATPQVIPGGSAVTPGVTPGDAATTPPGTTPGVTSTSAVHIQPPCSTRSGFVGGFAAAPCPSDPLNLPTATLSSAGSAAGVFGGSTGGPGVSLFGFGASSSIGPVSSSNGFSAPASINPERPLQLPGEAAATPTQAPITTAQDRSGATSQAGMSSSALCSAAMPSTAGPTNPANVFAGASLSGC